MAAEGAFGLIVRRPGTYLAAAAMGFGVNSLAYIVIQTSSSLTLKVCSLTAAIEHGYAGQLWAGIVSELLQSACCRHVLQRED
jgi:hypothetical protein